MPDNMKTRQETLDKILLLMCNYYQQALTQEVLSIYHELWAEYAIEDIAAAAKIWMKENRWFPLADGIIRIIEEQKGPKISIETRAQQQWRVILQQIKRHGAYHPPKFSDPITANLVKTQFSWSYLSYMKESEENWEQKRWCEAFKLAAELHKDLAALDVPRQVSKLLETTIKDVDPDPEPVPVDKIRSYRKMLEAQAALDEKDLDKTNARINLLQGQAKDLEKEGL